MVDVDTEVIVGGIIPIILLSCQFIYIAKEFAQNYKHFWSTKSPLVLCYVFMLLSCIAILVDAAIIISGNLFVYASMTSACGTFTAYAIVIFVWIQIMQRVCFASSFYISLTAPIFWTLMFLNWAGTMLLEYFLEAGNILITVSGPIVIGGYVITLLSIRNISSPQQKSSLRKITALSNLACAIFVLCTGFITVVIIILETVSNSKLTIKILHLPLDIGGIIAMTVLTIFLQKFASTTNTKRDNRNNGTSLTTMSPTNSDVRLSQTYNEVSLSSSSASPPTSPSSDFASSSSAPSSPTSI